MSEPAEQGQRAYVTVVCEHRTLRKDKNGYICPRYCGTGRHVLKLVPPLYRRRQDAAEKVPLRPHPAPEVGCRPATEGEVPAGARRLVRAMEAAGRRVLVTYARGTGPDVEYKNGRVRLGEPVESVVVRGERLRAVWENGRFWRGWWAKDGFRPVGLGELIRDVDPEQGVSPVREQAADGVGDDAVPEPGGPDQQQRTAGGRIGGQAAGAAAS
jgi:hypothetical protein